MREFTEDDFRKPLTIDMCREWLVSKVFRFRPADYCEKYPNWPGLVGLEVEMLPYRKGSSKVMPLQGVGSTSEILLSGLEESWQPEFVDGDPDKGLLRIKLDDQDQITFEPGGQLEFSSRPYPCLYDALDRMEKVQERLFGLFSSQGASILQTGINPWQSVDDIGLQMTKPRYRAMNQFFSSLGSYGPRMMRQTCTVQVNLDFGGREETLAKRYLAANLLSPIATAVFANSPFFDGKGSDYSSFRARVWQGLDDSRTGFPKLNAIADSLSLESCVNAYLDFLMNARLVFIEGADYQVQDGKVRFIDWLNQPISGLAPSLRDFEHHMSLHFPEVRPRGFLELRSVDCTPHYWQELPAIFYTSLLYDNKNLDGVLELMLPHIDQLNNLLERSAFGLKDDHLYELTGRLVHLVIEGFERLPACFQGKGSMAKLLTFVERFPSKRRTPADDLMPLLAEGGGPEVFQQLEDQWRQ